MTQLIIVPVQKVFAAPTPGLGGAASFAILSSTYTNSVSGSSLNGDLGYTTAPSTAPTVSGTTHVADGAYSTAGTDQGSALTILNSQACTFSFAPGPIDLATDTTHGPVGVYTPGVYCITGAASIGTAGMILSGSGTYIFRMTGALTTVTGSVITLTGSSACDVFWTPGAATTLGATTTFMGTDIDDSGITIGSTVTWTGRALTFGGTVSTTSDTITVPSCTSPTPTPTSLPASSSSSGSSSSTAASVCSSAGVTTVPNILEVRRVSPTSIFVRWGPNAGLSNFIIRYGVQNDNWQYNTKVSGFSTTINDLPVNMPVWIEVAATDNCVVGAYSPAVRVGGTALTNSLGFPNTGNVGLPEAGFDPNGGSTNWDVALVAGFITLTSALFVLVVGKRAA